MKREKKVEKLKKMKMKWHLLGDADRERVFRNTDIQAKRGHMVNRLGPFLYFFFMISIIYFASNPQNEYLQFVLMVFSPLLFIFLVYRRFLLAEVAKRRAQNFDRFGNQDFLFIEASFETAWIYKGDDHLGPYWLGFTGPEEALLLRGGNLLGFSRALERTNIHMLIEHLGAVVDVKGQGRKISMTVIENRSVVEALEKLMVKNGLLDFLILKGKRLNWLKRSGLVVIKR